MRQFFIASASSMKTSGAIEALTDLNDGQLAFALSGGETKITALSSASAELTANKRFQLLLGAKDVENQMRHVVIPIYAHHLSYSHMTYVAPKTFSAKITVNDPYIVGNYTVIVVKKGVPFNERNKWSIDVYVRYTEIIDGAGLAAKIAEAINKKGEYGNEIGVTASVGGLSNNEITITAVKSGVDYEVKLADNLLANLSSVTVLQNAEAAIADTAMIIDMANKAIADAGINDTYQEASEFMHPRYPITNGSAALAAEYDVITIRFAEPREMKTRDDIVHQIVQIAFPRTPGQSSGASTANAQVAALKGILAKLV